jgi:tetratricopeptide (TPR) repeat protein
VSVSGALQRAREAYAARGWTDAAEGLTVADAREPLGPADLERLATALFMVGRQEEYFAALGRAHDRHVEAGATRRAASCAFWIGMHLVMQGDVGRGGGWLGRAHRLLEHDEDCAEHGYLLLPEMFRKEAAGDLDGAAATAAMAAEVGRHYRDADPTVLATHAQAQFLLSAGRLPEGLRLLDEAMLAVTAGELSPIPTGIVYCRAIVGCQLAFDPRRAQEWTAALHAWCELQPDMLAFSGECHVHRAEIMQLQGSWADALAELDLAASRAARAGRSQASAEAAYRRGEILRLRGELPAAEGAYREAAHGGREPQPGLALLRLAQGDSDAAGAAIRRVLSETPDVAQRAALLPACAEIMLATGDAGAARSACAELERIAAERPSDMLAAMVAHTRGAVALADGDAGGALPSLRRALAGWHELAAPYEAARVRLLIAQACRALGDEESAAFDLDAARRCVRDARGGARAGALPAGARPDRPRAPGAPPGRRRRDEQGDRGRAGPQRAHREPPPQQHLREAPRHLPHRGDRLRVRAPAALSRRGSPTSAALHVGCFGR